MRRYERLVSVLVAALALWCVAGAAILVWGEIDRSVEILGIATSIETIVWGGIALEGGLAVLVRLRVSGFVCAIRTPIRKPLRPGPLTRAPYASRTCARISSSESSTRTFGCGSSASSSQRTRRIIPPEISSPVQSPSANEQAPVLK